MKKIIIILVISILLCFTFSTVSVSALDTAKVNLATNAKASYLCDENCLEEMYSKNSTKRLPIASMVKIMTALITLDEIQEGNLKIDEMITISETASGMGGSQMFLDTGLAYPVSDLLKGVIVVSANDACLALAERISGSEEAFVLKMNEKASHLGMANTNFANCTGLPAPNGYSCAKDVATMLSRLVKHDLYHNYSTVWLENYKHPDGRITTMTNTNKLIKFYQGCDGGKTGFTNEAMFCLAASAKKGDLRLISVVIGERDSKTRFKESSELLNYGFANYQNTVFAKQEEVIGKGKVIQGKQEEVPFGVKENLGILTKKGNLDKIEKIIELDEIKAPLSKGDKVGKIFLVKEDGKILGESELIALENVEKLTFGDTVRKIFGKWGVCSNN